MKGEFSLAHLLWACSAILIPGCVVIAAPQKAMQKPKMRNWAAVRGWITDPWNGNDKPYQQIRATIDNTIAGGRKPQDLVEFYEMPALEHPNDPQAQFKWAYAAYREAKQSDDAQGEKVLGNPREALVLAPFPHSYEYARLIFLTEDYIDMPTMWLMEVGKRLLKRNPSDITVKYATARNLLGSANPADRNLAYQYIHDLLVAKPEWASPHGLQGFVYYKRWQATKNKADGDKAIAEYQHYLSLDTLQDNDLRKQIQGVITEIQKG